MEFFEFFLLLREGTETDNNLRWPQIFAARGSQLFSTAAWNKLGRFFFGRLTFV